MRGVRGKAIWASMGRVNGGREMSRDMSERQFQAQLERNEMRPALMGYVKITDSTSVYRYNAGDRRRDQLAYL